MGKSQKPLDIYVCGGPKGLEHWIEFQKLVEQGHNVIINDDVAEYDLILGPTCWLMDEKHRKYLPLALAEARKKRYPKEEK